MTEATTTRVTGVTYTGLPEGLRGGARRYLEQGTPPGGFLRACLENNLMEAVCRADEHNLAALRQIAQWMHNECPHGARGSAEKVKAWIEAHEKGAK